MGRASSGIAVIRFWELVMFEDRSRRSEDIAISRIPHGSGRHEISINDAIASVQTMAKLPRNQESGRGARMEAYVRMITELRDRFGAVTLKDADEVIRAKRPESAAVEKWIRDGAILEIGTMSLLAVSYPEHRQILGENPPPGLLGL